jgi:hypothetical protein
VFRHSRFSRFRDRPSGVFTAVGASSERSCDLGSMTELVCSGVGCELASNRSSQGCRLWVGGVEGAKRVGAGMAPVWFDRTRTTRTADSRYLPGGDS